MSLLDKNSKKALVESMRHALISSVKSNKALTESVQMESVKFVKENATYEQLLNMTMNPVRESKYLPDFVMEGAVAIVSEALLSGRKVIGINALTEGAINLVKKTDCVVTESMLDAAEGIATSRGLHVVAEAIMVMEDAISKLEKKLGRKLTGDELKRAMVERHGYKKIFGDETSVDRIESRLDKLIHNRQERIYNGIETKKKILSNSKKKLKDITKQMKQASGSEAAKFGKERDEIKKEIEKLTSNIAKSQKEAASKSTMRRAAQAADKARRKASGAQQPVINVKKPSKLAKLIPKTKAGKIAAGASIAAGTIVGIAAAKKWHDKKKAQKMAASKDK